ncbi:MAG: HNH endonuclease [Bacteroidota bacterium]
MLDWQTLTKGFNYKGETVSLIGAKGIWKPKQIKQFPISITSVLKSNYNDEILKNGIISYSYRGIDPMHYDNVGLRECMLQQIPIIYLHQIYKGKYYVDFPFFVVGDDPATLSFSISAESEQVLDNLNILNEPEGVYRRSYKTREVLTRLHQTSFRERVLAAYKEHCTICRLKHRSLLDAAHIIPDSEGGKPVVQNGLTLCKIHHAAYDQNIIGISPDYQVEVREDILMEIDGPMLKHGLQETHGHKLILPRKEEYKPNKDWLDVRYQRFRSA